MTASAQLGNRLVAGEGLGGEEKAVPTGSGPVRQVAPTRPLPLPPVPVPPAAVAVPTRSPSSAAHRQTLPREASQAEGSHFTIRSSRVARLIATAIVTLAVVGGLSWLGQPADPGIPERTTVVRVGAGETVWDVAARVAPRSDPRTVVERIRQLNGMADNAIQPDQQLKVPDGQ